MDVVHMLLEILPTSDSMIGKTPLPYLCGRAKFFFDPKGESPLEELYGSLKRDQRRDQQMEVIRHQDEFVQKISLAAMRQERLEE
jgi:hypothetical protein